MKVVRFGESSKSVPLSAMSVDAWSPVTKTRSHAVPALIASVL
jgi:hypothetical protein